MKRAIITDSTFYFSEQDRKNIAIFQVPVTINFQEQTFYESGDVVGICKSVFEIIDSTKIIPTTSQPSSYDWNKCINNVKELGYEVIDIFTVSSKLSGTFHGAQFVVNELNDKNISVYDTKTGVQLSVIIVKEIIRIEKLENRILSKQEILEIMEFVYKNGEVYYVIDDMKYLKYGGRISNSKLMISNLLNIKAILTIKNGEMSIIDKQRSLKKGLNVIQGYFMSQYDDSKEYHVISGNALNYELCEKFYKNIYDNISNIHEYEIMSFGPSMSVQAGKGIIGLGWCELFKK